MAKETYPSFQLSPKGRETTASFLLVQPKLQDDSNWSNLNLPNSELIISEK